VALWVWGSETPLPSRAIMLMASVVCVLWSARTIAIGAILVAGLLAEALQRLRGRDAVRQASSFELRFWGVMTLILIAGCVSLAPTVAKEPASAPTSLGYHLRSLEPDTRLLADQRLSGWVIWESPAAQ